MTGPVDDWEAEYGEGGPNQGWFEKYMGNVERAAEDEPLPPEVTAVDLYVDGRFYSRMSREVFEEDQEFARSIQPTLDEMFLKALAFFEDDALPLPGRSPIAALLDRVRPTQVVPPPALRGPSSSFPPNRTAIEEDIGLRPTVFALMGTITARVAGSTEEERVTRELVPLVRAASAEVALPERVEVLGGYLREFRAVEAALDQHDGEQKWGQFLDRWDLTPDLTSRGTPGFLTPLDMRAAADAAREAVRHHENGAHCWCGAFMLGDAAVHLDGRIPPSGGYAWSSDVTDWTDFFVHRKVDGPVTEKLPSDMENIVPADKFSFPEPHPWPHSPNPAGIRRDKDGRIALQFAWRGKDYVPTDGWVVLSAPNGLLEIQHLTDEDVADWVVVEVP